MATYTYQTKNIQTIDGIEIEILPLKIKYLREFMDVFSSIQNLKNKENSIDILSDCVRICMKQFYPELSKSVSDIQDNFDINVLYEIIEVASDIKIKNTKEEKPEKASSGSTWETLDLALLESEVFLLGIWKDYEELELSLSMPELMSVLEAKRDAEYQEKKFLAAIQGVDLDKESGNSRGQKEWEDMKARVFSKGKATDSSDVLSLQGQNARKAGFGIGMGLDYEDLR
jgi:hypothetical protein